VYHHAELEILDGNTKITRPHFLWCLWVPKHSPRQYFSSRQHFLGLRKSEGKRSFGSFIYLNSDFSLLFFISGLYKNVPKSGWTLGLDFLKLCCYHILVPIFIFRLKEIKRSTAVMQVYMIMK
jgi:hypothetical protein